MLSYPANYWNTAAVAVEKYLDRYPKSAVEVRMGDKRAYRAYGVDHPDNKQGKALAQRNKS